MRGNCRNDFGSVACSKGYCLGSFGDEGVGKGGSCIGAYEVVVVVVVTTLQDGSDLSHAYTRTRGTYVVVLTEGARYNEGLGVVFMPVRR